MSTVDSDAGPRRDAAPRNIPTGLDFILPEALVASRPPVARGLARDQVRLLVGWRNRPELAHTVFHRLPDYLDAGDLLVVNNSATLPAALDAWAPDGTAMELHLSTQLETDLWVVEPRRAPTPTSPASQPFPGASGGMTIRLPGRGRAELLAAYGTPGRLWIAALVVRIPVDEWLAQHGRPIRYRYVPADWPLDYYQTVFAQERGSAEMPSAARPFSAELVANLVSRGVAIAPITLHCGVSSPEKHEAPAPERFQVPESTADLVNLTRRRGRKVIAVGTTVVRALETAVDGDGEVRATSGWTDLIITAGRGVRAVDGMITGWHEPAASHLAMLEAVAGSDLLARSYQAGLACGYLWHEFGDSHLILP
ncbi:MAG: S-adenosylmethionine:tRNA ribosyltransferase-isomerase [Acidimicrobiaceae bacterium]|nr:S-adenosylmethionine:tRNA ribosyltransferase-isomerase [Acidimicrobiaceae bacterium]